MRNIHGPSAGPSTAAGASALSPLGGDDAARRKRERLAKLLADAEAEETQAKLANSSKKQGFRQRVSQGARRTPVGRAPEKMMPMYDELVAQGKLCTHIITTLSIESHITFQLNH